MAGHIGPLRYGRWRHSERRGVAHAVGQVIWAAAVVATLILVAGVALTWTGANPANDLVHGLMRAGTWLASPFRGVFTDPNGRERLTENHFLAAAVYLTAGGVLSWIVDR
jgi:hypothetical protein